MLSVAVHKDIAEYQPKIVGKMTMRTLVSITGALSVSVLAGLYIYFVLGLNVSDCTYFIYAVSLPFWCVGFLTSRKTASRKELSMANTTESRETFAASNPTPQGQDGSSLNAAFDVDAFVHASGDGFGNTAPLRSDTGAIDMDAISQVAHVTQGAGKLTRKEKKHAKREMKRRKKEPRRPRRKRKRPTAPSSPS